MESTRHYRVALVEKAVVPHGAEGDNWFRYVLENKHGMITGWRRGSHQEIVQHATHYAEELNIRSDQGTSPWALRRKKGVPGE
jgi:hypothetical protein